MKKGLRISLRAGERIYVNGAVLRVDRKVALELLNDVAFLLEHHVMLPEDTTTPLRQLYFIIQAMLIDPASARAARELYESSHALLLGSFENEEILDGLRSVYVLVTANRFFEALKTIRALFPIERKVLGKPELEVA
jgi:flagellar protein FlbT